jgi:phosphate butyryltransferase
MNTINTFDELLSHVKSLSKRTVVIAAADNDAALSAIIEAKKLNIADGILIGNAKKIQDILEELNYKNIDDFRIIDEKDDRSAALKSIELIRSKEADILLKGKLSSSLLLKSVLDNEKGLRTGNLLSDVFIFEYPERNGNKLIMISDGGINLSPDLNQKIEIIKNAVTVAHALGNMNPKVAILSSAETVNPNLPGTIDAAIISKMNDRGQIKGCTIDGPLAIDNAISPESAKEKGINSPVAGNANILIVNNIETGNIFAKSTTYFAKYRLGHVVMGAKAPILIASRSDKPDAKLLSICLGILMSERKSYT